MDVEIVIMLTIGLIIILIFAVAQYMRESRFQQICKKIAISLLGGIKTLSDEDRKSFFSSNNC